MVVLNEGSSTVNQQVSDISTEKKKRGRKPKQVETNDPLAEESLSGSKRQKPRKQTKETETDVSAIKSENPEGLSSEQKRKRSKKTEQKTEAKTN